MDVVHDRAVGIDISKRDAEVCVRVPDCPRCSTIIAPTHIRPMGLRMKWT